VGAEVNPIMDGKQVTRVAEDTWQYGPFWIIKIDDMHWVYWGGRAIHGSTLIAGCLAYIEGREEFG
jgi:hypothetical protein